MKLLEWMCALDNIFVEFVAAGEPKSDAAMKAHAMSKVGRDLEAIATFLGQDEGVTYVQWQAAILMCFESTLQGHSDIFFGEK